MQLKKHDETYFKFSPSCRDSGSLIPLVSGRSKADSPAIRDTTPKMTNGMYSLYSDLKGIEQYKTYLPLSL